MKAFQPGNTHQIAPLWKIREESPGWHERCSLSRGLPNYRFEEGDFIMLWTILVILLVLWLVGLLTHVGGSLIHLLLVVAVIVLVINLVTGRRAV